AHRSAASRRRARRGSRKERGATWRQVIWSGAAMSTANATRLSTPVSTEPLPPAAHETQSERPGGTAIEKGLLVLIVLAMILLPTLEALLRRAIGIGVPDAMPYTQHLTLWVGFIGAMLATATERHLALTTVELLPGRWQKGARGYVHVLSALVTAVLAYASLDLVLFDRVRADRLAGGVPEWWFEIVMPGFALLLFFVAGTPVAAVPTQTFALVTSSTLPAIPLLTVAGYVLAEGGASQRLLRAARGMFGWMPGGLAVVAVFTCALFTTFTGASGVTILALGGIMFPALLEEEYPEGFSLGLITAAGSLGLLFPPSLPVLLYSVVAGIALDDLYLGGFVPGVLMILLVGAYGVLVGIRCRAPRQAFELREA